MKPKFHLLFSAAATDLASGGGASVSEPSAPAEPTASAEEPTAPDAPAQPEASAPSLLQQIAASVQSKAVLLKENSTLRQDLTAATGRAETAEAALITAHQEISTQAATIQDLRSQLDAIQKTLDSALAEATTTEAAAAAQVAAFGFPATELPESTKPGETREEIEAMLSRETDNDKRFALAQKLWDLS